MIKGDLTETNNNRKSLRTKSENKESITYLVYTRIGFDLIE